MKGYAILILVIAIAMTSCDDRKDYVFDGLIKPTIAFSKTNSGEGQSFVSDSAKLNFGSYVIFYPSNAPNVIKGSISLKYDNEALEVVQNDNLKSLTIKPLKSGSYTIEIIHSDLYNNTSSAKLYLTVFENLSPVAVLNYSVKNDFKVDIDLTNSFDKDKNFGGKILEYRFKIRSNYEFYNPSGKAEVAFPSKGTFPVTFWVKDNNNSWSDPLNTFITL